MVLVFNPTQGTFEAKGSSRVEIFEGIAMELRALAEKGACGGASAMMRGRGNVVQTSLMTCSKRPGAGSKEYADDPKGTSPVEVSLGF